MRRELNRELNTSRKSPQIQRGKEVLGSSFIEPKACMCCAAMLNDGYRLVRSGLVSVLGQCLPSSAKGVMLCTENEAQVTEASSLFATHAPHLVQRHYTLSPGQAPVLPSDVPCVEWLMQQRRQHPTISLLLLTPPTTQHPCKEA